MGQDYYPQEAEDPAGMKPLLREIRVPMAAHAFLDFSVSVTSPASSVFEPATKTWNKAKQKTTEERYMATGRLASKFDKTRTVIPYHEGSDILGGWC